MHLAFLIVLSTGLHLAWSCNIDETKHGCLISEQQCSCGFGCISDYRYDSMQECQSALKGRKKDICKVKSPCLHNGQCIQISQQPGYRCRCEGTGFFGLHCNRACPVSSGGRIGAVFPYECIVI